MLPLPDGELLRRYVEDGSQDAFAAIVQRHFALVYSAALRQVNNDAATAQDVAQAVFCDLARKVQSLSRHPLLVGWLYRSTRFAAVDAMRSQRLRRRYEQKAATMNRLIVESGEEMNWIDLSPVVDQMLAGLKSRDRDAILLRYFEAQSFTEVAAHLKLTEDSARMRVKRALEQLRTSLRRGGIVTTSAVLELALAENGIAAVPAGLVPAICSLALAGVPVSGTGAVGSWFFWKIMTTTKFTTGLAAALAVFSLGTAIYEGIELRGTRSLLRAANREVSDLRSTLRTQGVSPKLGPSTAKLKQLAPPRRPTAAQDGASALSPTGPAALEPAKDRLAHIKNPHSSRLGEIAGIDPATVATVRAWIEQDPEATLAWLGSIPTQGNQQMHTTEAVVAIEAGSDPQHAFELANSIDLEGSRIARIGDVLKVWAPIDPAAAASAVQAADIPGAERDYFLRKIAELKTAGR